MIRSLSPIGGRLLRQPDDALRREGEQGGREVWGDEEEGSCTKD